MTEYIVAWLRSFGELSLASGLALAFVFIAASFIVFPRTFVCLAAGSLYGFLALPIGILSTTIGSVLAFLAARYLFADRLRRRVDRQPHLRAVAEAIDSESWRIVALLRFAGPLPHAVQNYFFGLTRVGLWPYAVTTFVFTIPQTLLFVYLGAIGRSMLVADSSSLLSRVLTAAGALCLAAIVFLIWRKARTTLAALSDASAN